MATERERRAQREREARTRYDCAACGARAGESCTTPTDTGRRAVTWTHYARTDRLDNNDTPDTNGA
ncbi:hypothetical protein SEA_APIARY_94 [Rhodococcus phage Apiary]|nr:hypothetical protein SEA_MASELOP_94 [Rhodococcus phage Maselop]WNM67477.1 hypothetical protein SEA_POLYYUKI_93 [Rhodococcus phage Polyyuki]WNM69902.1 hypothetical protein SEA_APIARY_94 [Rhodococcus phage Apiary]